MKKVCGVCKIVGTLTMIGAINWGLVGFFDFNLVDRVFGAMSLFSRIIYSVIGLAGLMCLISFFKTCPACEKKAST